MLRSRIESYLLKSLPLSHMLGTISESISSYYYCKLAVSSYSRLALSLAFFFMSASSDSLSLIMTSIFVSYSCIFLYAVTLASFNLLSRFLFNWFLFNFSFYISFSTSEVFVSLLSCSLCLC